MVQLVEEYTSLHCNGNSFIYSFSGNSVASAPISTFMCLWAIYIFPGSVYIFPPAEQADPSWEYIIRSQTHECGNWDWGPYIPFLGIFVSNFQHFVFAVFVPGSAVNSGVTIFSSLGALWEDGELITLMKRIMKLRWVGVRAPPRFSFLWAAHRRVARTKHTSYE